MSRRTPTSVPAVKPATAHTAPAPTVGDFFEAVIDSQPAHICVLDEESTIIATNRAWRAFAANNGGDADRTGVGMLYLANCGDGIEGVGAGVAEGLRAILRGEREELTLEYPCHSPDEQRWFALHAERFEQDGAARVVIHHEDVSAHRRARDQADLRSRLLDEVAVSVIATDLDFRVIEWNRAAEELYGWTREEALGKNVVELVVPPDQAVPSRVAHDTLVGGDDWNGDITLERRDGSRFPAHVRDASITDADGTLAGYVGVSIDLTERHRADRDRRSAERYLKAVTDSMGEGLCTLDEEGRLVYMNATAERLLGWRLEQLMGEVIHPIVHGLRRDGTRLPEAESPITRSRVEATTVRVDDDLFLRSDGALLPVQYTAAPFETAEGVRGSVVVFSDVTERNTERERMAGELLSLTWVARIHEALAQDRLCLHAQPIIDIATGDVVQHELLVRMLDDEGGLVPPGDFLPAAERHGVIGEIDRWVVTQAAALAGRGHAVELNLSAESISDPDMAPFVEAALTKTGANPANVVIELTETAILRDQEAGRAFLARLDRFGCKIALDDFGTGYGGFTYLKHLPVDYLKIDIEFVRDLPRDAASQHVVQAVVQLAAGLGKQTVAEGVEDDETLALLEGYGVDLAQGFGIGRPRSLDKTPAFLRPGPEEAA
jgi:PAS domain S-box-containing protein